MSVEAQLQQSYAAVRYRLGVSGPDPAPIPRDKLFPAPPRALPPPDEPYVLNMLAPCSWRFLVALASEKTGIPVPDIMGPSIARPVRIARQLCMALIYQHTQASARMTAGYFGRQSSKVVASLKRFGPSRKLVEVRNEVYARYLARIQVLNTTSVRKGRARIIDKTKPRTELQQAVLEAYQQGTPPAELVKKYGCHPKSVKVIAHNLGLKREGQGSRLDEIKARAQ